MKQFLIIFLALLASNIFAQDVIIYTNGTEENSKVLEVSETEIRFKKWTNQNGPTYVKKVAEIFMIRYENGTKQTFTIQKQSTPSTQHSTYDAYYAAQPSYSKSTVTNNRQNNITQISLLVAKILILKAKMQKMKNKRHIFVNISLFNE